VLSQAAIEQARLDKIAAEERGRFRPAHESSRKRVEKELKKTRKTTAYAMEWVI
jgi:hypothetical protein